MSHANKVRVGDVGVLVILTVYEDGSIKNISSAVSLEFHIKKPDGTVLVKDATFATDGTDGKIEYTTEDDCFTDEGYYEFRGHFSLNTWDGYTTGLNVVAEGIN